MPLRALAEIVEFSCIALILQKPGSIAVTLQRNCSTKGYKSC